MLHHNFTQFHLMCLSNVWRGTGQMFNTSDSDPAQPIAVTPVSMFLAQHDLTLARLPVHNSAACSPVKFDCGQALHLQPCCVHPLLCPLITK